MSVHLIAISAEPPEVPVTTTLVTAGPSALGNQSAAFTRKLQNADILDHGALPLRPSLDPTALSQARVVKLAQVVGAHRLIIFTASAVSFALPLRPGIGAVAFGQARVVKLLAISAAHGLPVEPAIAIFALSIRPGIGTVALGQARVVKLLAISAAHGLPVEPAVAIFALSLRPGISAVAFGQARVVKLLAVCAAHGLPVEAALTIFALSIRPGISAVTFGQARIVELLAVPAAHGLPVKTALAIGGISAVQAEITVSAALVSAGPRTFGNGFAAFAVELQNADILDHRALALRPGLDPVAFGQARVVELAHVLATHRLVVKTASTFS